jgi:peptidoglycan/LPS O-acetylase OafA/YrhL
VGFVGAAALRGRDRPKAALVGGLALAAATCFMAAAGAVPDRYPATPAFVVPALSGTLLLYALVSRWSPGRLVEAASTHTLGVFVGHYAVLLAARWWLPDLPTGAGLAVALALTAAFALGAPLVPTLPWSLRKGPTRTRTVTQPAAAAALVSSSSASPSPWAMSQTPGTVSRQATSPKSIDPM